MAKKKASNQPIVAEEPARPEEQFRLEESQVAPPSTRKTGDRPRTAGSSTGVKSYGARSASERRAGRAPRSEARHREHKPREMRQEVVAELLEHPTRTVSEAELRKEYGYVTADLRSMAVLSAGLIVALVVLAQILPK